jgi:anti-anti-sigma factor
VCVQETDSAGLEAARERHGTSVVLRIAGDLDLSTEARLRAALLGAVDGAQPVRLLVVDLAEVRFCGARGLGVLLDAAAAARSRGCALVVAGSPPTLTRLAGLLGLDLDLVLVDDVDAALRHTPDRV